MTQAAHAAGRYERDWRSKTKVVEGDGAALGVEEGVRTKGREREGTSTGPASRRKSRSVRGVELGRGNTLVEHHVM